MGSVRADPEFQKIVEQLVPDKSTTLLFSCRSGPRSGYACEVMEAAGYTDTINMAGGMVGGGPGLAGWVDSGLPVATGGGEGVSYASIRAAQE